MRWNAKLQWQWKHKKKDTNKTASSILRIFHLFRHKNGKESFLIRMKSQDTKDFFSRFTLSPVKASNRPFATSDHVVQKSAMLEGKLIIIPSLGHQNKGKSSFTGSALFVFMSQCGNNNKLALQHGGFCTTWSLVAKGLFCYFTNYSVLHSYMELVKMFQEYWNN